MTYGFLLESIWHPPLAFAETAPAELPAELELQALWFSGAFGREFRTMDGREVRMVQFGEWNRGAGPDFAQCVIEIDGEQRQGSIELENQSSDWESHGHGLNPNFSQVILHIIFRADPCRTFIRTVDHKEVPQILISEAQLADALNRPFRDVAIAHPGRCVSPLKHLPISAVERLLDDAAQHRAASKAARFLRTAAAHDRDLALFQATAETLGYRANVLPMRLLAQRAPVSSLRKYPQAAEAILFGTAGFLAPWLHELAPDDTREYLRNLWDTWWKHRDQFEVAPARAIQWKSSGQRPANHPHRRVGTLATLIARWPQYRKLALARPFAPKPLLEFLQSLEHPFWSHRYTLNSSVAGQKVALFGKPHALELLANHLIPLALHENSISYAAYRKLRSTNLNEKVKRCAIRLFGSQEAAAPWLKHISHHQALMQVYQDFCLEDSSACQDCPFPEQLAQWR